MSNSLINLTRTRTIMVETSWFLSIQLEIDNLVLYGHPFSRTIRSCLNLLGWDKDWIDAWWGVMWDVRLIDFFFFIANGLLSKKIKFSDLGAFRRKSVQKKEQLTHKSKRLLKRLDETTMVIVHVLVLRPSPEFQPFVAALTTYVWRYFLVWGNVKRILSLLFPIHKGVLSCKI